MGVDESVKENLKQLFLVLISAACMIFLLYVFFSGNIAGKTGIYEGSGGIYESMLAESEIKTDGFTYIENMGKQTAPKLKYISGAQEVGSCVVFKGLFTVTTSTGEKNGVVEDDFAIYLKDITDSAGNSVIEFLTTEDIENLEEIPAAFIYDKEQDLLYFYKSGIFIVQVKVYGSDGADALYEFTIPVEVS